MGQSRRLVDGHELRVVSGARLGLLTVVRCSRLGLRVLGIVQVPTALCVAATVMMRTTTPRGSGAPTTPTPGASSAIV